MDAQIGVFQALIWRPPPIRSVVVSLALAAAVLGGMALVTRDTSATRIAYCATSIDRPGELLNVSVMQQQPDAPVTLLTSETEADGCGEFQAVPRGRPVMIVVWTDDGYSTGSTGWVEPGNVTETLSIQLESQAFPLAD
jgi:hypothetical protein